MAAARRGQIGVSQLRVALVAAAHGGEVAALDVEGDGELAAADRPVVDRRDRRHLDAGAGQEHLVGEVELGSVDPSLDDVEAGIGGDAA